MDITNQVLISSSVSIAALITSVFNLFNTRISRNSQIELDSKVWLRNQIQNAYVGAIGSLSTLLTLGGVDSNLDTIEQSIAEAKKCLALALIYAEHTEQFKEFDKYATLFISGQYPEFLEAAKLKQLKPAERYLDKLKVYGAADLMLKKVLEIARCDKRLF